MVTQLKLIQFSESTFDDICWRLKYCFLFLFFYGETTIDFFAQQEKNMKTENKRKLIECLK